MSRARDLADSADKDIVGTLTVDGLDVAGNIVVTGTVDGRDVATDGTKLNGIESNATADQTASEILTALLTVDGTGTTLDADLLDGQHGSYYTTYADTAITNLVDSSPAAMNTLNELAAALGDDANFSTTVTNSIATKLPLAGGTLSGALDVTGTVTADGLTVQTTNGLNVLLESSNSYQYLQFKNSGETNNYLGFVNDDFSVTTANATTLTVTAEGNVGIPFGDLTIGSGQAEGVILELSNTDSVSNGLQIQLSGNGKDVYFWNYENAAITFATNNEDRFRIAADGSLSTLTLGTSNVRFGVNAGNSILSGGNYNVVVGDEAGTAITTGDYNTAIGYNALATEDANGKNVAVGFQALLSQNAGTDAINTAVGYEAGAAVSTGIQNTLIGGLAGDALNTSSYNTVVGYGALSADTKGERSTAVGHEALASQNFASTTVTGNTALGFQTGRLLTTGTYNTIVGHEAGTVLTTGIQNTLIGGLAGDAITTGNDNTTVGYASSSATTTGIRNAVLGKSALFTNTTGGANTAIGYSALYSNTTASNNTGIGYHALVNNTTGAYNTAVGIYSMESNTTASDNVAVGGDSLYNNTTGASNVAVGVGALVANTTASNNTAVGKRAGYSNTTGTENQAFGHTSLHLNTTGNYNNAFGRGALYNNTTGSNNVALGTQALVLNTTASNNTAVGYQAGYSATTSGYNTFIGQTAGYSTTGVGNTFVGCTNASVGAGYFITTGTKNTIIGGYHGNQGGLDIRTLSNHIVLSDGDGNPRAYFKANGDMVVPRVYAQTTGTAANVAVLSSGVIARSTSSLRYKNTVQDATHGLADLLNLRSVTFKNNNDGDTVFGGLIAEEVHDAGLAEFVQYNDEGEPDALAYGNIVSLCIKAIQEQQTLIETLETSNSNLVSRIETLEAN
jgi:hypothetical protein